MRNIHSLIDLLRWRASHQPDAVAYRFLLNDEDDPRQVTYAQLDERARNCAAWLERQGARGERVLLLYPSSLDFIVAFFGCLYASAVAVPAYPPASEKGLSRLNTVVKDAAARFALTSGALLERIQGRVDEMAGEGSLLWQATDRLSDSGGDRHDPSVDPDTLAVLQYTSGSTSSPKGVMLAHRNLLHNLEAIRRAFGGIRATDAGVFWLPMHHDMGLVGGVLEPMYSGGPGILMSPTAFLQRPLRWLEAISRFGASITTAPNSAYDLCVDRSTEEERKGLSLSSLRVAFCGAETVRRSTLDRFTEAFAPHGFRRDAFLPCYGLAEATLLVSSPSNSRRLVLHGASARGLKQNTVVAPESVDDERVFVGCGRAAHGQRIVIVDPETRRACGDDQIGEIWTSGPGNALGYWRKLGNTAETFAARLATGEGRFLRTGDLGFVHDGELFVAGRLKDLIIIRGQNYYSEDLEAAAQASHRALLRGRGAAFSLDRDGAERLVIVQEVDRRHVRTLPVDEVVSAILLEIAETFQVQVDTIVLVGPLTIPTTSSGKIQRYACRDAFVRGNLKALGEWRAPQRERRAPAGASYDAARAGSGSAPASRGSDEIQAWLISQLAAALGVPAAEIDVTQPFAYYGLDSVRAVQLAGQLEGWLGRACSPTLAYEYPTVEKLAQHLADRSIAPRPSVDAAADPRTWEPIAIVGIGCRFPGAHTPHAFWNLLRGGVDAIREVPEQRWDLRAFYDPDPTVPGKMNTRWGGFLEEVDRFDPSFFGISPREAARMDPQQRLLLETAWEALEDAGIPSEGLAGTRTGVFVGISTNDYGQSQLSDPALSDAYAGTGNALSIAANRLSYHFDFRGPSLAIDTACSSSLVAVHLACRSLRMGDCTLAVTAGVNLILSPSVTVNFTKAGFMTPEGRCKAFDAEANGYVRGEGVGAVVLKPLSRALADGDPIRAVILGSAVNSDGRTNGLTAPSREAQEAVLIDACRDARVSPCELQYVEAHGTGTALGDPIEASALANVLAVDRPPGSSCALGSVKTNIGHLEAAAGIAGLIKVVLALEHREIPPSLHFRTPNPLIPFERFPLHVQQSGTPWPESERPVAGVSSFGFGGTNAHVVLTQAPRSLVTSSDAASEPNRPWVLPLSAHTPEALHAMARAYLDFMTPGEGHVDVSLLNLCHSACKRRSHFDHRLALVARSHEDGREGLRAFLRSEERAGLAAGRKGSRAIGKPVFVFSGQGHQWWAMGRELMDQEPVYLAALEECDALIQECAGWSLIRELSAGEADSRLADTAIAQPALFGLQAALAALWRSWGVEADAVVGHSVGEIAAAYVASALDLPDAIRLVVARGRLMQRSAGQGRMAAVALSPEEARAALAGFEECVSVASENSSCACVLSGEPAAVQELVHRLGQRGVAHRWLPGGYAFHSPQMEPYRRALTEAIAGLQPRRTALTLCSTVTGQVSEGPDLTAEYWGRQLREPVRFARAIRTLTESGHTSFIEIGPHAELLTSISQGLRDGGHEGVVLPSLRRGEHSGATMLASIAALYTSGLRVEWSSLFPRGARYVRLPHYPWQRERCWFSPNSAAATQERAPTAAAAHPLLGRQVPLAHPAGTYLWELELGLRGLPYLDDHRIDGHALLPVSAYLEMAMAAGAKAFGSTACEVTDVSLERPLVVPDQGTQTVQFVLSALPDGEAMFRVYSHDGNGKAQARPWTLNATGRVRRAAGAGGVRPN